MSQTPTSGHTHTPAKQKEVPAGPGGVDVAAQNDPSGPGGKLAAEAAAQYDQLSGENDGLAGTRSAHDNVAAATSKAIQDQINKQAEGLSKDQSK
ncbi:hypothetical protein WJX74_005560 [Apatococcus lobatus]|uniref:Antitoxin n=2 Tax=Apatococcus TaxID=904362 RepID=A0AAW1SKB3_9CHLO